MSTAQPKKSVALIGNQMNVSKEWLDQVKILETGTTEQKIALAGSDDLCDSIQLALAKDADTKVKIALSKNPKLTKLTEKILAGQTVQSLYDDVKYITDEETLRILWQLDFKSWITENYNIPESVKLDILDCAEACYIYKMLDVCGYVHTIRYQSGNTNGWDISTPNSKIYGNLSREMQIKIINLLPLAVQQKRGLKHCFNYWSLAHTVAMGLNENKFNGVDMNLQILLAENLVQLYKDIKNSNECKNADYGVYHTQSRDYLFISLFLPN